MRKAAVITGITGQDGSYMAEMLLDKGYVVYGVMRRSSKDTTANIRHLFGNPRFLVCHGDVLDPSSLADVLDLVRRRGHTALEVYNFAAQSHVQASFDLPVYTAQTDAVGVLHVLEAVRRCGIPGVKVCQASTSEMFGASPPPQSEATPFHPRSPYGVAKLFGYWAVRNYREAYDMFACNAIGFNHESERRGAAFVTRKITLGVARIALALQAGEPFEPIELGNLDAKRDWGHAIDVVRAMWLMMQQPAPDDYVIATGIQRSVRDFVDAAFAEIGRRVHWQGWGVDEVGVIKVMEDAAADDDRVIAEKVVVRVNPAFFRPSEVQSLKGDATKLHEATGWAPCVSFRNLVKRMVCHDMVGAAPF